MSIATAEKPVKVVIDTNILVSALGFKGDCNFIISGDKDLLIFKSYKKIKILTASQFLEILAGK